MVNTVDDMKRTISNAKFCFVSLLYWVVRWSNVNVLAVGYILLTILLFGSLFERISVTA